MMYTSEETSRMKALAIERISYIIDISKNLSGYQNAGILVKVGLEVDEEFKNGVMQEHIWFEVKSFDEYRNTFMAELTQEPYYIAALKRGDMRECAFDEITDWVAFLDGDRISPDSVYKLEKSVPPNLIRKKEGFFYRSPLVFLFVYSVASSLTLSSATLSSVAELSSATLSSVAELSPRSTSKSLRYG